MPLRGSSYASVAAGISATATATATATAAAAATAVHQVSENSSPRGEAFSHLLPTSSPSRAYYFDSELRNQHSASQEPGYPASGGSDTPNTSTWTRGSSVPSCLQTFALGNGRGTMDQVLEGMIRPSYLRGTRYMEKLEEAQKLKLMAQKETAMATHNANAGALSSSSSSVNLHRMAPSHRGMTYDIIEHQPVVEDDAIPVLPTKWAEVDKFGALEVQADGHDLRFAGQPKLGDNEACSARTDHFMPIQGGMYYYEVHVKAKGTEGMIGIGFSSAAVPLERLPGWQEDSWAYHGDDGKTFNAGSHGKAYGPTFSTNDVIGCGVNFMTRTAFFTKNGSFLGTAFRELKDVKLFPSIGMRRTGAAVKVNFGQEPFMFDIDGMVATERANLQDSINAIDVTSLYPTPSEGALVKDLIAQFLRHDGYIETAKAFSQEVVSEAKLLQIGQSSSLESSHIKDDLDAVNRQGIRAAILDGDIDRALKRTHAYYPHVLGGNPRINFRLRCRKFVEMMRQSTELLHGPAYRKSKATNAHTDDVFEQAMELDDPATNSDDWDRMDTEDVDNGIKYHDKLEETLRYAQELMLEYKDDPSKEVKDTLKQIFSLFAYPDPRTSPTAHLLDPSGRAPVAEELNSAILVSLGKPSSAAIERMYQQTEVLASEISDMGGAGAFINLHDFV